MKDDSNPHINAVTQMMGETADILAVVALLLTVVYADGPYDAWDFALVFVAFVLCFQRLQTPPRGEEASNARKLAHLGLALAFVVGLRGSIEGLCGDAFTTWVANLYTPLRALFSTELADVLLAGGLYKASSWLDQKLNQKPRRF